MRRRGWNLKQKQKRGLDRTIVKQVMNDGLYRASVIQTIKDHTELSSSRKHRTKHNHRQPGNEGWTSPQSTGHFNRHPDKCLKEIVSSSTRQQKTRELSSWRTGHCHRHPDKCLKEDIVKKTDKIPYMDTINKKHNIQGLCSSQQL